MENLTTPPQDGLIFGIMLPGLFEKLKNKKYNNYRIEVWTYYNEDKDYFLKNPYFIEKKPRGLIEEKEKPIKKTVINYIQNDFWISIDKNGKDNLNFCKPTKGFLFHELGFVEGFTNITTGEKLNSSLTPIGIWYNQDENEKNEIKNNFQVGRCLID